MECVWNAKNVDWLANGPIHLHKIAQFKDEWRRAKVYVDFV